ncbi:MAG TPA: TIGR02099 family protein, partial [Burkholderiaceae bacterium]
MLKKQHDPDSTLARTLAATAAAYRRANRVSHHVLGFTVKLLVAVYFLFALLFLLLRYIVLPNIDFYKGDIERIAGRVIGSDVKIARIYASWQGLRPNLFLGDVTLRGRDGRTSLNLPSVSATLSWLSVPAFSVRFERLEVIRPELDVTRDSQGRMYVAGIFLDPSQNDGKGKGMDWLLSQREIVIREGVVHWNDHARNAPRLSLGSVNLLLRNRWRRHRFALEATPPQEFGGPVNVRANFVHPAFAANIADVRQWKGELYTSVQETDLAAWRTYVTYPVAVEQGRGSVRAWMALDHARLADFTADLTLTGVVARFGKEMDALRLKRVNGRISARETIATKKPADGTPTFGALGHTVAVTDFSLETFDGLSLPPTTIAETYTPAQGGQPEKRVVSAKLLDLGTLASMAERLPVTPATRQMLRDFAPR